MLIFQMGPRVAKFVGQALPDFPAHARIEAALAPDELFGKADLTGRLSVMPPGHSVQPTADVRHGGIRFPSGGSLPAFSVSVQFFDAMLSIDGGTAVIESECSTDATFKVLIEQTEHHLPALLSAALFAPVEVISVGGSLGGQAFTVEFQGTTEVIVRTMDQGESIRRKLDGLRRLPADGAERVLSAHRYLLQARRLRYVSSYPSEFLGERLLNLYKAIEVLFGRDVDPLRRLLEQLDLKGEVVELLAGLVYVRDEIDVGHPAIRSLDGKQYETLHRYAEAVEEVIPWLLDHLVSRLAEDRFQLRRLKGPSKRSSTLEKAAKSVGAVKYLQPETFLRGS